MAAKEGGAADQHKPTDLQIPAQAIGARAHLAGVDERQRLAFAPDGGCARPGEAGQSAAGLVEHMHEHGRGHLAGGLEGFMVDFTGLAGPAIL